MPKQKLLRRSVNELKHQPRQLNRRMKPPSGDDIPIREYNFIKQYLTHYNAAKAYLEAGYSQDTKNSAKKAYHLLQRPHIKEIIDRELKKLYEGLEISAQRVLLELARVAFMDFRNLYNSDGTPKQISELDERTAGGVVNAVINAEGRVRTFRTYNKMEALQLLGAHMKLWENESAKNPKEEMEDLVDRINAALLAANASVEGPPE